MEARGAKFFGPSQPLQISISHNLNSLVQTGCLPRATLMLLLKRGMVNQSKILVQTY
jgi:hypothetical protein